MPRLSIVLVVHREQGFIRPAVTSLLDSASAATADACQVVVLDDAAADHSGEIADEVAAADPRLVVHHLDDRLGQGSARARALSLVTGDYVWFAEPFDLFADGVIDAVLSRLEESDPDLLVVGHVRRDLFGRERPGATFSGGQGIRLWDTVVRTAYLTDRRAAFDSGSGWERAVTDALLAAAPRIDVLDRPGYVRRELPRAVRARSGLTVPAGGRAVTAGSRPAGVDRQVRRLARPVVRAARDPRRAARRLRSAPMRSWYRLQQRRPLDENLAVFAAYWYAAYSCNPRAVYEKARELVPSMRGVWVVTAEAVPRLPAGVEHVVAGSRDYYRAMARATYLVNNVNFPNDIVKRPGQVHLQTHHGTPLKTMGMDLVKAEYSRRRMNFPRLMKRIARWDYSVSQNAFTSEYWERVYPSGTYESIETGYPRNDVLATATVADRDRVRAELGIGADQVSILYLPTHREYHPGYVPQLDPARLAKELGPDHVLMVRAHYFYAAESGEPDTVDNAGNAGENVLDVADHPRIEDLYLAADVLVTDYSSAMFDYAVLDRPIVIYAPDWDEYRTLRGTTFDLMAEPPGAVATTEAELTEVLASGRAWDDDSAARRRAFRARFTSLEDGKASERVVRMIWPASSGGPA